MWGYMTVELVSPVYTKWFVVCKETSSTPDKEITFQVYPQLHAYHLC